jgi:ParB family chromosome partitioning protein
MASSFKRRTDSSSTAGVFQRRPIEEDRLAVVEAATAHIPVSGEAAVRAPSPPVPDVGHAHEAVREVVVPGQLQGLGVPGYEVGKVYEVSLGAITSNPMPPRAIYLPSTIKDMSVSLQANGQRLSATGYVGSKGELVLIEGETRLRASKAAGLPTLRVEIRPRPVSPRALYEEARAINVERKDQSCLDDALRWRDLIDQKLYDTQASLARAMAMSDELVSRTLSLAKLPSRIINAVAEYPGMLNLKMLTAIREFWELQGDEETLKLIFEVAEKNLGSREVTSRRVSAQKGPVRRPRSVRENVEYRGGKGELRSFEGTGRVELILKGLTPDAAESLSLKIKEVLAAAKA